MTIFKQILAWILIITSIFGILVCVLGIAGSWLMNDRLTVAVLNLLRRSETALSRMEDSLTLVDAQLIDAGAAVETIREAVSKMGERIEKNSPVLDRIGQILKDELGPTVNKIQDAFLKIEERGQAVNNTIEFVNLLPGIELPRLNLEFEGLQDRVDHVVDVVGQLQQNVADFRVGILQNLSPFMEKLDTVAAFLTRLQEDVNNYLSQVDQLQIVLASAKVNIPSLIDRITLIVSIVFLWLILAQIGLLLVARVYLNTGQMAWDFKRVKSPREGDLAEIPPSPGI